jgi:hypothetical protein
MIRDLSACRCMSMSMSMSNSQSRKEDLQIYVTACLNVRLVHISAYRLVCMYVPILCIPNSMLLK